MRSKRAGSRDDHGPIRLGVVLGAVLVLAGAAGGFWYWRARVPLTCPQGELVRELKNPDETRQWLCLLPTGVREGPAITFDTDRRKRQLDHYTADRLEGLHQAWSPRGVLIEEGPYRNGLRQGGWTLRDPKTEVETQTVYDAGKRIGKSIAYFPNGQIKEQASYENDALSGEYTSYFMNGKTEWTGRYLEGRKIGLWKQYDALGDLIGRFNHGGAPAEVAPPVSLAGKVLFAGRPASWWKARIARLVEQKKSRPELGPLLTLTVDRARRTGLTVEPTSSGFEVAEPRAP